MTKQEILDRFNDIDFVYNDSSKHETLSRMLDELLKEQESVKPYRSKYGKTWHCGNCDQVICSSRSEFSNYCRNCGRKVKWK